MKRPLSYYQSLIRQAVELLPDDADLDQIAAKAYELAKGVTRV